MPCVADFIPNMKLKNSSTGEWAGPCPICKQATKDGFIIWENRPHGGNFECRKCGAKGSGVQLLRDVLGVGYVEACRMLEVTPKLGYGKKNFSPPAVGFSAFSSKPFNAEPCKPKTPTVALPPMEWSESAETFLSSCQNIEVSPNAVKALASRYLTPATAYECGIGWNSTDRYPMREDWGLDFGKGKGKLVLPMGIVLATRRKQGIVSLTIRTFSPERNKYHEVVGGARGCPFVIGKTGVPVVIFESAMDAILMYQEAGDLCATVGMMGNAKTIDYSATTFINSAPLVIACPDNDEGGNIAWKKWSEIFPSAMRFTPHNYKDVGDMHKAAMQGEDVPTAREWLEMVLEEVERNPDVLRNWAHMAITKTA